MDEYELEEIKREIVESRSLTIKTNNLVNALAADLKSIARRQQAAERRNVMTSATAYAVTVGVILLLVKVAWDYQVQATHKTDKGSGAQLAALKKQVEALNAGKDDELRARRAAAEGYELIRGGKRRKLIAAWPELSKLPLTRAEKSLFEDAVRKARGELSIEAYQVGLDHVRTGRWHEAQAAFTESLKLDENAAHAPRAKLELARSLIRLGRQQEAVTILHRLSQGSPDREILDDATFLKAKAQVDLKAWNDAKSTLRSFIRRFPKSAYINDARMMQAEISLKH